MAGHVINMKLYLGIITNGNEYKNIEELTSVWESFDGIAMVLHQQGSQEGNDKIYHLVSQRLKDGFIVMREYYYHNGHSMNDFLLNPKIVMGDWIVLRDSSERLNPDFAKNLKGMLGELAGQGVKSLWHKGKLLAFERGFNQQFVNGLHWGLMGCGPGMEWPDGGKDYAYSVRNETRATDHRYRHEVFYLINYGPNGNHLDLFHHSNPAKLQAHRAEFIKFLDYLDELGCKDVDKWGKWLGENPMNPRMMHHINLERPLRNYYRYFILLHTNEEILKDEDTWRLTDKTSVK